MRHQMSTSRRKLASSMIGSRQKDFGTKNRLSGGPRVDGHEAGSGQSLEPDAPFAVNLSFTEDGVKPTIIKCRDAVEQSEAQTVLKRTVGKRLRIWLTLEAGKHMHDFLVNNNRGKLVLESNPIFPPICFVCSEV
ncbi:uncharacterized protein CIMG_12773 [Coccidioides immitis RS]|uniref:Uncharacterized protein n=1 Tax=Coccidioides immitis (strain RS) TaxID=246410 RepID=A0A0D8JSP8_COCIM|nr:uncharacterized protein CIMG_12773 [Coccidioides immitis RS]KJF60139.1 hypothetical protein CIMG_12773 [Coccidioides immitis RS]